MMLDSCNDDLDLLVRVGVVETRALPLGADFALILRNFLS